jgi:hypothetical protein
MKHFNRAANQEESQAELNSHRSSLPAIVFRSTHTKASPSWPAPPARAAIRPCRAATRSGTPPPASRWPRFRPRPRRRHGPPRPGGPGCSPAAPCRRHCRPPFCVQTVPRGPLHPLQVQQLETLLTGGEKRVKAASQAWSNKVFAKVGGMRCVRWAGGGGSSARLLATLCCVAHSPPLF